MEALAGHSLFELALAVFVLGVLFVLAMRVGEFLWRVFLVALGIAFIYFGADYLGIDLSVIRQAVVNTGIIQKLGGLLARFLEWLGGLVDAVRAAGS